MGQGEHGGRQLNYRRVGRRLIAAALISLPAAADAAPANTLREMFDGLRTCLAPAGLTAGSAVTVVFSLRRDGTLIGKPRIAFAKTSADPETTKRDFAAIAARFDHCLPMPVTDALGGAIAGRPIAIRFVGGRWERGV